ncbi:MAG: [NiFe]-hydrogenase assembly chaperone HybE [Magnetococcales bacterium]|nr:[NiFe]-hydrogenase assembly chaperone HybE [Magnetococcales bacterium]
MAEASHWQLCLLDDEALLAHSIEIHTALYQQLLQRGDWDESLIPSYNPAMPIVTHSFRHMDDWRIFLLLTPWMLARLLLPKRDPGLPLPSEQQNDDTLMLLGPLLEVELLGQRQKAHLHYHPLLGHYLIQPLIQSLHKYSDADAVLSAWSTIVDTRDTLVRKHNRRCEWQQDVSRREMFSSLLRSRSHEPKMLSGV